MGVCFPVWQGHGHSSLGLQLQKPHQRKLKSGPPPSTPRESAGKGSSELAGTQRPGPGPDSLLIDYRKAGQALYPEKSGGRHNSHQTEEYSTSQNTSHNAKECARRGRVQTRVETGAQLAQLRTASKVRNRESKARPPPGFNRPGLPTPGRQHLASGTMKHTSLV